MLTYAAPPNVLARRTILITGATGGIGRAAAVAFAAHGATLILLGRNRKKLEYVYDTIEASGAPRPAIVELDLESADPEHYTALAGTIEQEFGRLDGLLHTAAELGVLAPIEQYDVAAWRKVMNVNLDAAFLLTRACLPLLKLSDDASVVFTTADVGRQARAYWGAYAAASFALEGLAQLLADELMENTRVRVNTFDPGPVRTDFRARAYPGENPKQHPEPEAIMSSYLYLLGPASRGVSGRAFSAEREARRHSSD